MPGDPFLGPYADIRALRAAARKILGVGPEAGLPEIRAAFRRLSRRHHPDLGGDPARFTRIVNAYLVLTRPDPRGFPLGDAPGEPESHVAYFERWKRRFFE
ncbi:J domain-containing protein [Deferrisoma palaeochoriense]